MDALTHMAKAAELLRVQMAIQRMTQSTLSDLTGIPVVTVGRHCRGENPMSGFITFLYAQALGVDQCRLLPRLDSNQQPFDLPTQPVAALASAS